MKAVSCLFNVCGGDQRVGGQARAKLQGGPGAGAVVVCIGEFGADRRGGDCFFLRAFGRGMVYGLFRRLERRVA